MLEKSLAVSSALLTTLTLSSCDVGSFTVSFDTIRVVEADDRRGDEPALLAFEFMAVYDSGTVRVDVHDDLHVLGDNVDDGESRAIGDAMPLMTERQAGRLSSEDMNGGMNPGIGGVIVAAIDMDGLRRITRNKAREAAAEIEACLEDALREHVADVSWPDRATGRSTLEFERGLTFLTSLDGVNGSLEACGESGVSRGERTFHVLSLGLSYAIKKLFRNAGGDPIGQGAAIFLGVEPDYFAELRDSLGFFWPGSCDEGELAICPLDDRELTLDLIGGDGHYQVDLTATFD